MLTIAEFEPWWQFGFSLLIGALIGLEREFYQQKEDRPDFAGIRTFFSDRSVRRSHSITDR